MQLKQLLVDEKAVSPVIGVILMVAITVIIGAIVGTFVLGLGDQVQDPAPTVQFNTEYTPDAGGAASDGAVTVTHGGGEEIAAGSMAVKGDGVNVSDGTLWYDLPKSSASESSAMVSAGDDAVVGVTEPSGAGFRLVWQSEDGRSSVLAEWEQ